MAFSSLLKWRKLVGQAVLLAMRAVVALSKLLLAIYTARYLGLADLGIYGLLISGTTIVPAMAGLGLTEWIVRKIVDLPRREALPLIAGRLSLTFCIHLVVQPLLLVLDVALGEPIPLRLAVMAGVILMLENLGAESCDLLIARRHVFLSNALTFFRAGVWPLIAIAVGLAVPEARTLDALLQIWIAVLAVNSLILIGLVVPNARWRHMRPDLISFVRQVRHSRSLYLKDVSGTVSSFVDRFLISMFLGLELTGVYTFFWSVTNAMHSLVVVGLLQSQIASLHSAGRKADKTEFRAVERHLQVETGLWIVILSVGIIVVMPWLLPFLGRALLHDYLPVLWIILFATVLRVAADGYGLALLSLNRDSAIAAVAVCGASASAAMNGVLTPLFGLWGAAIAYVVTAAGLFAIRFYLTRSQTRPSAA